MIVVQFGDVSEFLNDVRADQESIEDGVVRVTVRTKRGGQLPTVDFWLVASCVIAGRLVFCEEYMGGGTHFTGGYDAAGKTAAERTSKMRVELEHALGERGLEVRRGIYTVQGG